MVVYYAVLVVVTAAVASLVFPEGSGREAERSVAGGYDVAAGTDCLGAQVDLVQSGRFVDLETAAQTSSGKLELHGTRLTGDVDCASDTSSKLDARLVGQRFAGSLGG